ncbi:hypothetical protein [Streptomyces sp. NPDC058613]|uniref:hypothetical protein n=1 Tax=unclassified Streptomyces TaxID=2593676 RepID=UPI0036628E6A
MGFLRDAQDGGGGADPQHVDLEPGEDPPALGALYENQPEESEDGFADGYLLEMAYFADILRGPVFDDAVKTMKYADFVTRSDEAFEKAGGVDGQVTPVVDINGSRVPDNLRGTLFNRGKFVQEIRRNPQRCG